MMDRRRPFELIACKKRRRQVWNRRINSLKKMASVLSHKCGIDVALVYSLPEGDLGSSSETIFSWPDDARECRRIVERFRCKGVKEREKNEDCLLNILKERKKKLEKNLQETVADDGDGFWWDRIDLEQIDDEEELVRMVSELDSVKGDVMACAGQLAEASPPLHWG